MLPRCASSHAITADRLPRPVRDLPRWMHFRRVENRHAVGVGEHADHPQVRGLRLDAGCCPHFTVRPMLPYAAGSCSSTASTTRTINPEQLGTEKSSVAAQRAAALNPVNTAVRAPVSSACRRSSWARKADSHLAHRCLPVLPDREGTSLGCGTLVSSGPGSLRSRLSWSYGVRRRVSGRRLVTSVQSHFTIRTHAEACLRGSCGSPVLLGSVIYCWYGVMG